MPTIIRSNYKSFVFLNCTLANDFGYQNGIKKDSRNIRFEILLFMHLYDHRQRITQIIKRLSFNLCFGLIYLSF